MKAVRYHSYGDSGVLVYEDADRPAAGTGQVVVKVAGAAFNPLDVAIRAGFVQQVFPVALPHIPNYDVAGVITEAGEGVNDWSAGDAVVAFLPMTAPGAAAEYVAAAAGALAAAPRSVDLADAAVAALGGPDGLAVAVRARRPEGGAEHPGQRSGRRSRRVRRPARQAGRRHRDRDRQRAQHRPHPLLRRGPDHRPHRHPAPAGGGRAAVRHRA